MTSLHAQQNIVYTVAEGELTDEDYNRIIPLLEERLATYEKIRWYFEMKDFEGWSLSSLWKDLKFSFKNRDRLEMVAMVGEKKWEKDLTQLMKPFTQAEVKYFDEEDRANAKIWISKIKDEDR